MDIICLGSVVEDSALSVSLIIRCCLHLLTRTLLPGSFPIRVAGAEDGFHWSAATAHILRPTRTSSCDLWLPFGVAPATRSNSSRTRIVSTIEQLATRLPTCSHSDRPPLFRNRRSSIAEAVDSDKHQPANIEHWYGRPPDVGFFFDLPLRSNSSCHLLDDEFESTCVAVFSKKRSIFERYGIVVNASVSCSILSLPRLHLVDSGYSRSDRSPSPQPVAMAARRGGMESEHHGLTFEQVGFRDIDRANVTLMPCPLRWRQGRAVGDAMTQPPRWFAGQRCFFILSDITLSTGISS